MRTWDGWTHSEPETAKWLEEARSGRLKRGKQENKAIRLRVASSRLEGDDWRADLISLQLHKKSISFTRVQRLRQLAEQERDLRRVGAASRRGTRKLERSQNHAHMQLFEFEPGRTGTKLRDARDLYWEWISRGFSKGEPKNITKRTKPRIKAREAKWKDREFEDKIVYIERADALEDVSGNLISNMGADQPERLGCASRIEELERLSRSNAGVYTHCILAMPADLSPQGRADVLREICDHYGRLKLPYCAALHKPDPNNSQRNFHAHILVGLRPMERIQDRWEFESTKLTWLNTTAGLKLQRRVIGSIFNAALDAEKSKTRFTARSRAADGLAPGGFTKRGGVRRAPATDSDISDVLNAREAVAKAEALDGALGALQRTAERLDTCEERLDSLLAEVEGQAAATKAAGDPPRAEKVGQSPKGQATAVTDKGVANSQRHAERTPGEAGDGPGRTNQASLEIEDLADIGFEDPPSVQQVYVPLPPAPDDWKRRRRRLNSVRRAVAEDESWEHFDDRDRQALEGQLDEVVGSLVSGDVVITGHGEMLRISSDSYDALTPFENIAKSKFGWNVLARMSDEIEDLTPQHHPGFEMHSNSPPDRTRGLDDHHRGMER